MSVTLTAKVDREPIRFTSLKVTKLSCLLSSSTCVKVNALNAKD